MTDFLPLSLLATLERRATEILPQWKLPPITPVLVKYRENAVFRVARLDGGLAGLRLHRPGYHGEQALRSEMLWLSALHKAGLSVPEPIATIDGDLIVRVDINETLVQHADLLNWLPGKPLGESGKPLDHSLQEQKDLFFQLGASMARLHAVSDEWVLPPDFSRPAWNSEGLLGDAPVWGRFWDCEGLTPEQNLELSALRERLAAALERLQHRGADYGLIHADLVRENILVHNGTVSLIDFDDAGFGWRMFDIATALLRNRREPHFKEIRESLIAGYRSERALPQSELDLLPLFLTLRSLAHIGWVALRPEMPGARERLARYLGEARELAAEPGGIGQGLL